MSTILVTGANRGIGLEISRQLVERGDAVIAVCRSSSDALAELGCRTETGIDVSEQGSVSELAQRLEGVSLDWLVNNAGVLQRDDLDGLDFDAMEWQFRVNTMGPLRVTQALLPNLGRGSRVGIVTSRMGSIDDNTSGGYYGYRMSKAAVNMAGMSLARDLKESGVAVALLHPGMVATEMTSYSGIPVTEAASGLIQRMDELSLANSGGFWHANGESLPW